MGDLVTMERSTALTAMTESELVGVLQSSLYPGAALNSIKMVIGYCKAANLDPMQKPVHIVPMWDKNAKAMRDVIMPGVGLYRTQASRTNALAGISKPVYGPMITMDLGGVPMTFPEFCEVTIKRLLPNGGIAEYVAEEYWLENYATAGKDSLAPNAMWKKRPRAQLAKCAQAQALRTAFPEMTGSAPTADEMEGKQIEQSEIDITPKAEPKPEAKKEPLACSDEKFAENKDAWRKLIESGKKTADSLIATLNTKAALTVEQCDEIKSWLPKPAAKPVQSTSDFDAGLTGDDDYVPE